MTPERLQLLRTQISSVEPPLTGWAQDVSELLSNIAALEERNRELQREMELRSSRETRAHTYEESTHAKRIAVLETETRAFAESVVGLTRSLAVANLNQRSLAVIGNVVGATGINDDRLTIENAVMALVLEKNATKEKFDNHLKAVEQFLTDMYSTMIDPVSEGTGNVQDTCTLLLKEAQDQRQREHDKDAVLDSQRRLLFDLHAAIKDSISNKLSLNNIKYDQIGQRLVNALNQPEQDLKQNP